MFFNLFKRKKKIDEEIKFDDLTKWLESETIQGIMSKFQNETKDQFFQLSNNFDKIQQAIQVLRETSIENRKANEKIKSLVLQNRDVYVEYVEHLISKLRVEAGAVKLDNVNDIENFIDRASDQLTNFSKHSFKSFHLTSELIGRELESVVTGIAALHKCIEKIKAVDKEKIKNVGFIKKNLTDITEKENFINQFKTEITKKEEEKQDIKKRLSDIQEENEKIQISSEWKRKQELKANIDILNKELETNSSAVLSLFLAIEKALKKWAWKEKNDKVLRYLEKPLEMIKQDNNFEIINILSQIKEDISHNKLELDERRKEQMLKAISAMTKEKLFAFIDEENRIKNEIEKNKQELDNSSIKLIDASQLINQENELISEIAKLEKRQKSLEQEISFEKNEIEAAVGIISNIKLIK